VTRLAVLVVAVGVAVGMAAPVTAQGRPVLFQGRVLWIAGQSMVVQPDGGVSVRVDLKALPQSDYQGLSQGERIVVYGTVSGDQRQVSALSLRSAADSESP
jgi:hypothetical protein